MALGAGAIEADVDASDAGFFEAGKERFGDDAVGFKAYAHVVAAGAVDKVQQVGMERGFASGKGEVKRLSAGEVIDQVEDLFPA